MDDDFVKYDNGRDQDDEPMNSHDEDSRPPMTLEQQKAELKKRIMA